MRSRALSVSFADQGRLGANATVLISPATYACVCLFYGLEINVVSIHT